MNHDEWRLVQLDWTADGEPRLEYLQVVDDSDGTVIAEGYLPPSPTVLLSPEHRFTTLDGTRLRNEREVIEYLIEQEHKDYE